MQRPAWWIALVGLAAVAMVVLVTRTRPSPTRAPVVPVVTTVKAAPPPESASSDAAPAPAPATSAIAVTSATPNAPPPPPPPPRDAPPWPAGAKYVLQIGDTSLGFDQGLALEMKTRFEAAGIRYDAFTEIDGGLHSYATSKKLEGLLRWKKPDVVLVSLGMNNLTTAKPDDYEVDVKSIIAQIGDRPCWWIGPLSIGRPEHGLIAMLARATAPCGWMNSYDLAIERQPDHLHPTQPGASHWADAIWLSLGAPLRDATHAP